MHFLTLTTVNRKVHAGFTIPACARKILTRLLVAGCRQPIGALRLGLLATRRVD
jgi:hypothetical protein